MTICSLNKLYAANKEIAYLFRRHSMLKKFSVILVAFFSLFAVNAVTADTVCFNYTTTVSSPDASEAKADGCAAFRPRKMIVFDVVGKRCTWNSSADPRGSGAGEGCNYTIDVNTSTGKLSNPQSNGKGCTQPSRMLQYCKEIKPGEENRKRNIFDERFKRR